MIVNAEINNVPEKMQDKGYIVARIVDNELWYYGIYEDKARAVVAAKCVDGIILEKELESLALEQEPKWDRLYRWLNDMRFGIAPDETVTDIDERNGRMAQVDLLDEIMEWMVEPQESEEV